MPKVHTACKNCIFALYDGKTQMDCSLGRLDSFKYLGEKIVEVYDDEKEFYVIEGRLCQFYRTQNWKNKYRDTKEQLNKETQIGVDILLLVHNDFTFKSIQYTIKSIKKSTVIPQSIVIVFQSGSFVLTPENKLWLKKNCPCKFSYEIILEPEPTIEKCINLASRRSKTFYICMSAGSDFNKKYIEKINHKINKDMVPLMYISPPQIFDGVIETVFDHMFVSRKLHDYIGGFGKKTIEEKVNNLIEDDNSWKNIKSTYETICK